jgi:predicted adenylyl cyclase CyaB
MPLEYEFRYFTFNKNKILKLLQENGGSQKGHYLFRVMIFSHPLDKACVIRIRDEGYRITMTYKENTNKEFQNENEVIINDFEQGVNIFLGLGCKKKYYFEKMREIWNISNTEIVFDTSPGLTEIMEIESQTKKELLEIVALLKLDNVEHDTSTNAQLYEELFGIVFTKNIDLTFNTVKSMLKATKNKKDFNKLIEIQHKLYKKIIKK